MTLGAATLSYKYCVNPGTAQLVLSIRLGLSLILNSIFLTRKINEDNALTIPDNFAGMESLSRLWHLSVVRVALELALPKDGWLIMPFNGTELLHPLPSQHSLTSLKLDSV